jgi:hypothetical protein
VLILDCCHSGAFAQGAKGVTGESVGTKSAFEGIGYGRVVLTATDATQYAWEGDQVIGHADNSVFTHYMIEGLKTGAADSNGDGWITLDELYDYVYEQVVTKTPRQVPGKWSYKQQGDLVIAKNPHPTKPKPAELPLELRQLVESPIASAREAAVRDLTTLLNSSLPGVALAAREALERLGNDDSRRVATVATEVLRSHTGTTDTEKRQATERTASQVAASESKAAQFGDVGLPVEAARESSQVTPVRPAWQRSHLWAAGATISVLLATIGLAWLTWVTLPAISSTPTYTSTAPTDVRPLANVVSISPTHTKAPSTETLRATTPTRVQLTNTQLRRTSTIPPPSPTPVPPSVTPLPPSHTPVPVSTESSFYISRCCGPTGYQISDQLDYSISVYTIDVFQILFYPETASSCSDARLHVYLDGNLVRITEFVGPISGVTSTGWLDLGPVSPGYHSLLLRPEGRATGQPGDCNTGTLGGWAGTLRLITSYYP